MDIPLLKFPWLVLAVIFKNMELYELCCLSLQSKRTNTLVKESRKKEKGFSFSILLEDSIPCLEFRRSNDEICLINFHSSGDTYWGFYSNNRETLSFENCNVTSRDGKNLIIQSDDKASGFGKLFTHLSTTFNVESYSCNYKKGMNQQVAKKMNQFLGTLQMKPTTTRDYESEYSYEEIILIMPLQSLKIRYPKMEEEELQSLFGKWLAGTVADNIVFSRPPKRINIRDLVARGYEGIPEIASPNEYTVTRADGNDGDVHMDRSWFEMYTREGAWYDLHDAEDEAEFDDALNDVDYDEIEDEDDEEDEDMDSDDDDEDTENDDDNDDEDMDDDNDEEDEQMDDENHDDEEMDN